MAEQLNLAFFPTSYSELFGAWNRYPKAVPYAGGTALVREQGRQVLELPPIILSLERLEEMHRISRSERYMEIGAMAKISQVIELGKIVPAILRQCLEGISGPQLRNMATLGGNICFRQGYLDCPAALIALDAQYELRTAQSSRWVAASRFASAPGSAALGPRELLTRIRVPLDDWDYSVYRKFGGQASRSKIIVLLAKTQKNILNDIRIVCKAGMILRDKDSESILIGKHLPLSQKIADDFMKSWKEFLASVENLDAPSKKDLEDFVEIAIGSLSE